MSEEKYGMNFTSDQLSNNPILLIDGFGLIAAVIYWNKVEDPIQKFRPQLFLFGAIGSAIGQVALLLCFKALCCGPQGPASAIMVSATLLLTLVEAIRKHRVPTYVEFLCLALGFVGAVEMAAPEIIEKVFCCFRKKSGKRK